MTGIRSRPAAYDKKVALILQGGGALGSYQAGVYEALANSPYLPDWVAGISIGGINAALIAGNPPERRVDRLRAFWDEVTSNHAPWPPLATGFSEFDRRVGAASAVLLGQPGFFNPWPPADWLLGRPRVSYYDTAPLKRTLERLIDFDLINSKTVRFSVGAVNVRTGNFAYFDNARTHIRVEHVMAGGALPPGFEAIEIDGEFYWDGGLVSNTPLQYVLEENPRRSHLVFQIDLFPAHGPIPENLDQVGERDKDIRYSSRTRAATNAFRDLHNIRRRLGDLLAILPEDLRQSSEARHLRDFAYMTSIDIVELIYRPREPQGEAKDYEFSRGTMLERWAEGRADGAETLDQAPWLEPVAPGIGVRTFDVRAGKARRRPDDLVRSPPC